MREQIRQNFPVLYKSFQAEQDNLLNFLENFALTLDLAYRWLETHRSLCVTPKIIALIEESDLAWKIFKTTLLPWVLPKKNIDTVEHNCRRGLAQCVCLVFQPDYFA